MYKVIETQNKKGEDIKILNSKDYNYSFNRQNGVFIRFGKTLQEDPKQSPFGPEILDIEISTVCSRACAWCYKSNTAVGKNMSLETFKIMFDKFPKTLTQIAFGIGDISANKELFDIMAHCVFNKIVPNITINGEGLTDEYADKLAHYCGAVAVSYYNDDLCFNAVQKLTSLGMKQINIHALMCEETYDNCFELMKKAKTDERLKNLNAIVFLWLKPKGKRNQFNRLTSLEKYKKLVNYALDNNQRIGFDSCSANSFLKAIRDRRFSERQKLAQMVEPCESTLFSYYINVDGIGYPCSFCEGLEEFKGIDVVKSKDFVREVWNAPETRKFMEKNLQNCRNCTAFNLEVL